MDQFAHIIDSALNAIIAWAIFYWIWRYTDLMFSHHLYGEATISFVYFGTPTRRQALALIHWLACLHTLGGERSYMLCTNWNVCTNRYVCKYLCECRFKRLSTLEKFLGVKYKIKRLFWCPNLHNNAKCWWFLSKNIENIEKTFDYIWNGQSFMFQFRWKQVVMILLQNYFAF